MAESRGKFEWNLQSNLMALLYNMNISSKSKALSPDAFNPYAKQAEEKVVAPLSILKEVFVKKGNK